MSNPNDQIQPGQIKFLSAAPPPLTAGEYAIRATQKVAIPADKNQEGKETVFANDQTTFWIGAPRFKLNPSEDIHSVYPADEAEGNFFNSLPYVVLDRKTLPWERTIDGSVPPKDKAAPPWIALLLLDEDEIQQHDISLKNVLLKEIFSPAKETYKIIPPAIHREPWDNHEIEEAEKEEKGAPRYTVMDIPLNLFTDIVPYTEELSYLVHVRQVDTGSKEAAVANKKGWFSSLIGNRLPKKNKTNAVFLVSLEGHGKYLQEGSTAATTDRIRLVVLHHWSFHDKGLNFKQLVEDINSGASLYRTQPEQQISNKFVQEALHHGYTPLNHDFREGSKSISWYRGPLVPGNIDKPPLYMFHSSDGAMRYDERTGMFDVSYSAAWQLGRLLALENPGFSEALNNWKNGYVRSYRMDVARQLLETEFGNQIDFAAENDAQMISEKGKLNFAAAQHKTEADELIKYLFLEIWNLNL